MLTSLIVGFGHSGRALHLRSLLHARRLCKGDPIFATSRIVAVDPRLPAKARVRDDQSLTLVRSLDAVEDLDPAFTVAHVCTPPLNRVETLERLGAHGYRRIVCEKPVASSLEELHEVLAIVDRRGFDTAVVSPWLSSTLTLTLADLVESGSLGALRSIHIVQHKPRFARTRDNLDHPTAFEVEIPHSAGVALRVGGRDADVVGAASTDMTLDGASFSNLGGASMELRHGGGARTTIECDLTSPVQERSIELGFEGGTATGHYPVGGDSYAQLCVTAEGEPPGEREVLRDDQLAKMMIDWYTHYAGLGPRPVSDLAFNVRVMDLIATAKRAAGIEEAGRIVQPPLAEVLA